MSKEVNIIAGLRLKHVTMTDAAIDNTRGNGIHKASRTTTANRPGLHAIIALHYSHSFLPQCFFVCNATWFRYNFVHFMPYLS